MGCRSTARKNIFCFVGLVGFVGFVGVLGCPSSDEDPGDPSGAVERAVCEADPAKTCVSDSACQREFGNQYICLDDTGCCYLAFCLVDSDCEESEVCEPRRNICIPANLCDPMNPDPVCGANQECIYRDGVPQCVSASDTQLATDSCVISPKAITLVDGESIDVGVAVRLAGSLNSSRSYALSVTGDSSVSGAVLTGACTGMIPCSQTLTASVGATTCSVDVTVLPQHDDASADMRVSVFRESDGLPFEGATIAIEQGGLTTFETDSRGQVTIAGGAGAAAVSFFHPDYNWVTYMSPSSNDIVFYVTPKSEKTKVTGVKGRMDFSRLTHNRDISSVSLGLAGLSVPENIIDLSFVDLLGEVAFYPFPIGAELNVGIDEIPLGSGLHLDLASLEDPIKDYVVATGTPGDRLVWGLGGKILLDDMIEPIGDAVSDGQDDLNIGRLVSAFLPFFTKMDHFVDPSIGNVSAVTRPASPTTMGPTGEYTLPLPYDQWPLDEVTFTPDTFLSQEVLLQSPQMPCKQGSLTGANCARGYADLTASLVMSVVPGYGFVPLGISGATDVPSDGSDTADGVVVQQLGSQAATEKGSIRVDFAPPHDGLEGYPIAALNVALDFDALSKGEASASAVLAYYNDSFQSDSSFGFEQGFQQLQGGSFDRDTKQMSVNAVGANNLFRVSVNGIDDAGDATPGSWSIYFDANITTMDLNTLKPARFAGRDDQAQIEAMTFGNGYAGATPLSYSDLVEFNSTNPNTLARYIGSWSIQSCTVDVEGDDWTPHCVWENGPAPEIQPEP